jgi:hypothetical protein
VVRFFFTFLHNGASTLTKEGSWSPERASIFRASMTELGLLVLILVFSITLLRRHAPEQKEAAAVEAGA